MKTLRGGGALLVTLRRSHTIGMQSKVHPMYKTKYRVANWPAYNQAVRLEFPILSLNPGLEATLRGAWRLASSNEVRSHASLKGHTPLTFAGGHMVARAELNNVR